MKLGEKVLQYLTSSTYSHTEAEIARDVFSGMGIVRIWATPEF